MRLPLVTVLSSVCKAYFYSDATEQWDSLTQSLEYELGWPVATELELFTHNATKTGNRHHWGL